MLDILIKRKCILTLLSFLLFIGCNKEWEGEQYVNNLSFVNSGYNKIYVKYDAQGGEQTYRIPIQISGSTIPDYAVNARLVVDTDTIDGYNFETFRNRTDLYYEPLAEKHYSFDPNTVIEGGKGVGYVDVDFNFQGIDMYTNYFLALTIDPASDLPPNPRKYYKKSLVHINLFNDYSGKYSVANEVEYQDLDENGNVVTQRLKVETRTAFVVDENTVFFYAGLTEEESLNRADYRIYMTFIPDEDDPQRGTIKLDSPNKDLIGFEWDEHNCSYYINEEMDAVKPYLKRVTVSVTVDYSYLNLDYSTPEQDFRYYYTGSIIMQRTYNTLMPEQDQIIW